MSITSIKLFVSSTFIDMQEERNYLMGIIVPKLTLLCAERGLKFFCYDLRWGITEEEQTQKGTILPCIRSVEESSPFFVGILGERYGWIPSDEEFEELHQFGFEEKGVSITELEILHGALNTDIDGFCSFYFRDPLSSRGYVETDEKKIQKLKGLKQRIRESKYPCYENYKTAEEFGNRLYDDFSSWLNQHYPKSDSSEHIEHNKQLIYQAGKTDWIYGDRYLEQRISDVLRNGVPLYLTTGAKEINAIIPSAVFNANWEGLESGTGMGFSYINVSLAASEYLRYGETLIKYILRQIEKMHPGAVDTEYLSMPLYGAETPSERNRLYNYFRAFCEKFSPPHPVYIFVTDVHLLKRKIDRSLYFFTYVFNKNINMMVTSYECRYQLLLEKTGWYIKNFYSSNSKLCEHLMRQKMLHSGKKMDDSQFQQLRDKVGIFYDYEDADLVFEFLMNHVTHEQLSGVINYFVECAFDPIPMIIEGYISARLNAIEREMLYCIYNILIETDYSVSEGDLLAILSSLIDFSSTEWVNLMSNIKPLIPVSQGEIRITNTSVKAYIDGFAQELISDRVSFVKKAVRDHFHEKLVLIARSPDIWDSLSTIDIIHTCLDQCINSKDYGQLETLYTQPDLFLMLMTVSAKYEMNILRKIFSILPENSCEKCLIFFSEHCNVLHEYLLKTIGVKNGEDQYLELLANIEMFDSTRITGPHIMLSDHILLNTCSEDFIEMYSFLRTQFRYTTRQTADEWYRMAVVGLSKYSDYSVPECTYTCKLFSVFALKYSHREYLQKVSTSYLLAAIRQLNEYEFVSALFLFACISDQENDKQSELSINEIAKDLALEIGFSEIQI